ncbi:MAG TPA: O-antigen ligase family protein [Blastocatellia bacterium]|nr:O-antigen ligase family protein [Blastocatellia bacterium]
MQSALRIEDQAKTEAARGSHNIAFAGLFVFTLLLYLRPNEMFPEVFGDFPLAKIVALISLLGYFGSKLMAGERLSVFPLELRMLGVILLLGVALIPAAASAGDSIELLTDTFLKVIAIFVLLINLINTRERMQKMMKLVVVCGSVLALFALMSYVTGKFTVVTRGEIGTVVGLRISGIVGGIFGNPNDLATSLDLLIPFAVALALLRRGMARLFYLACAAMLGLGVILTFSRGGFLGLVAMAAVLIWKLGRKNRAMTVAAFVVITGVFMVAMPVGYMGRITTIFDSAADSTGSSEERQELLERAVEVASNHLIIGVGIGNYPIYSLKERRAHNSYLETSAELGVAGLIAYLIMIFAPLRSLRRVERDTLRAQAADPDDERARVTYYLGAAVQASLIVYIICSCFGSIQYLWFLYYPLAYAICLRQMHKAEATADAAAPVKVKIVESRPHAVLWRPNQRRKALAGATGETVEPQP